MAFNVQFKRSSVAEKRPVAANMLGGEVNLNINPNSAGLFFKDANGAVIKVGPAHVGSTAPNATPGAGGSAGNSIGEFWYDSANQRLYIYNGTAWEDLEAGLVRSVSASGAITVDNTDPVNPVIGVVSATTTNEGVVQLNDTTTSTSVTEALTANQGKVLQDQINALSVTSNITLAGTINPATGLLATVTAAGTAAGFVAGQALPSPSGVNNEHFVISEEIAASYTPTGGSATQVHVGDWFLSDGSSWTLLDVGFQAGYATNSVQGVVRLSTDAQTQAGVDSTVVVTPASLQSKLSDSVSTVSSTTVASSTAVKTAKDAADAAQATADAAIPRATVQAKGDLVVGTGNGVFTNVGVGTDNYVLLADSSSASGVTWFSTDAGTY